MRMVATWHAIDMSFATRVKISFVIRTYQS
jgi:hypothetical protein